MDFTLAELGLLGTNALVDYGVGRAFGEDNGKAAAGALGSTAGLIGGTLAGGSILPNKWMPVAIAGQLLGGWTGDRIYDALNPPEKAQVVLNHHLQNVNR